MIRTDTALTDRQTVADQGFMTGDQPASTAGRRRRGARRSSLVRSARRLWKAAGEPLPYLLLTTALVAVLMAALAAANYRLAPLSYSPSAQADVARVLADGQNYAVFDLNLDTRGLRRAHIAALPARPDVAVLGASHWQEAHAGLLPGRSFYNAHVHRDYYEDLLAVVEMMVRHDRLPRTMIMSIRDLTFLPDDQRTDALWLTALPDSNAMLGRLGIAREPWLETRTLRHWLGLLSLSTMLDNGFRRLTTDTRPGPSEASSLPTMDVLQADGSIRWSRAHRDLFTPERRDREVQKAFDQRSDLTLQIDPVAVHAIDRLLALLTERGVRIVLVHPPLNPEFYREVQGTPYGAGLLRVEALTARLAAAHGATVVGSFDPAIAGCTAGMYIDAEHSSPACLRRVIGLVPGL